MMKASTQWIERVLYYRLLKMNRTNVFPHVTPKGWWECDMFATTKAGYWSEYEIKMSRSDFLNDFKKKMAVVNGRRRSSRFCNDHNTLNKHELLAAHDIMGPSYYWFCTPEGLVDISEVPEYAGLIEFPAPKTLKSSPHWSVYYQVRKKAPRLHGEKFSEDRDRKLAMQIPYRYQRAYFETVPKLKREIAELREKLKG